MHLDYALNTRLATKGPIVLLSHKPREEKLFVLKLFVPKLSQL